MRWLALSLTLVAPAMAQDVLGTAVVDGRRVELLSDNTWREVDTAPAECRRIEGPVLFCGDPDRWPSMEPENPSIDAAFETGVASFAAITVEEIGRDRGADDAAMRTFLLDSEAQQAGVEDGEDLVIAESPAEIDGRDAMTLVMTRKVVDIPSVVATTYHIGEDFHVRALTWELFDGFRPEHRALHRQFLSQIQLDPEAE